MSKEESYNSRVLRNYNTLQESRGEDTLISREEFDTKMMGSDDFAGKVYDEIYEASGGTMKATKEDFYARGKWPVPKIEAPTVKKKEETVSSPSGDGSGTTESSNDWGLDPYLSQRKETTYDPANPATWTSERLSSDLLSKDNADIDTQKGKLLEEGEMYASPSQETYTDRFGLEMPIPASESTSSDGNYTTNNEIISRNELDANSRYEGRLKPYDAALDYMRTVKKAPQPEIPLSWANDGFAQINKDAEGNYYDVKGATDKLGKDHEWIKLKKGEQPAPNMLVKTRIDPISKKEERYAMAASAVSAFDRFQEGSEKVSMIEPLTKYINYLNTEYDAHLQKTDPEALKWYKDKIGGESVLNPTKEVLTDISKAKATHSLRAAQWNLNNLETLVEIYRDKGMNDKAAEAAQAYSNTAVAANNILLANPLAWVDSEEERERIIEQKSKAKKYRAVAKELGLDGAYDIGSAIAGFSKAMAKSGTELASLPGNVSAALGNEYNVLNSFADEINDFTEVYALSSGALSMTAEGEESWGSKIGMAGGQMLAVLGGGKVLAKTMGQVAALTTSGMVLSQNEYFREAQRGGLSGKDAGRFSMTAALFTGLIENVSPQKYVFGSAFKKGLTTNFIKQIAKSNIGYKAAFSNALTIAIKEIPKEILQEIVQETSTNIMKAGVNATKEGTPFEDTRMSGEELKELVILTAVLSGGVSVASRGGSNAYKEGSPQYKYGMLEASRNPNKYIELIRNSQDKGNISKEEADAIVNEIKYLGDKTATMPSHLSGDEKAKVYELIMEKRPYEEQLKNKNIDSVVKKTYEGIIADYDVELGKILKPKEEKVESPTKESTIKKEPVKKEVTPKEEVVTEAPKERLAPKPIEKEIEPKQQATNDLISKVQEFNDLPTSQRDAKTSNDLKVAAEEMGVPYTQDGGQGRINLDKKARWTNTFSNTSEVENHVPLTERTPEAQQNINAIATAIDESGLSAVAGLKNPQTGESLGMRSNEINGAVKDIREGKNTVRAQRLMDMLDPETNGGNVAITQGSGKYMSEPSVIPIQDFIKGNMPTPVAITTDTQVDTAINENPDIDEVISKYADDNGDIDYGKLADDIDSDPDMFTNFVHDMSDSDFKSLKEFVNEKVRPKQKAEGVQTDTGTSEGVRPVQEKETTRAKERIESGKTKMAEGFDELASLLGAKKNIMGEGNPLNNPTAFKAVKKIVEGFVESGAGNIEAAFNNLRSKLKGQVSDEHIEEIVEELKKEAPKAKESPTEGKQAPNQTYEKIQAADAIPKEVKEKVVNKTHEVKSFKNTEAQAKSLIEEMGIDESVNAILGQKRKTNNEDVEAITTKNGVTTKHTIPPIVITAMTKQLATDLTKKAEIAKKEGDAVLAEKHFNQVTKLLDHTIERASLAGQSLVFFKMFSDFYASKEGMRYQIQKSAFKMRQKGIKAGATTISKGKEAGALNKEAAIDAVVNIKKKGLTKKASNARYKTKVAETRQAKNEIKAKLAEIAAKIKERGKGSLSSGLPIDLYVEYGANLLKLGYYNVKSWKAKMSQDLGIDDAVLDEVWGDTAINDSSLADQAIEFKESDVLASPEKAVRRMTKEMDEKIEDVVVKHYTDVNKYGKDIKDSLMEGLDLDEKTAGILGKLIDKEFKDLATKKKREVLKRSLGKKARNISRKKRNYFEKLIELTNAGALKDSDYAKLYGETLEIPDITNKDVMDKIDKHVETIQSKETDFEKNEAIIDMLDTITEMQGVSTFNGLMGLYIGNLFSSPTTHFRNVLGNAFFLTGSIALAAARTGVSRHALPDLIKGTLKGMKAGAIEGISIMKSGKVTHREISPKSRMLNNKKFKGVLAPLNIVKVFNARVTFPLLAAVDSVFYHGAKEATFRRTVRNEAKRAGKNLDSLEKIKQMRAEVLLQLNGPDVDMNKYIQEAKAKGYDYLNSRRYAYEKVTEKRTEAQEEITSRHAMLSTHSQPIEGAIGEVGKLLNNALASFPVARLHLPVVNIAVNIANESLNWTPYGFKRALYGYGYGTFGTKIDKVKDREEYHDRLGKAVVGTTVMVGLLAGLIEDEEGNNALSELLGITVKLHGNGPDNFQKGYQKRDTGWIPNSIQMGDTYFAFRDTPMAIGMAGLAGIVEHKRNTGEDMSDAGTWAAFASSMPAIISEQTYLKGMSDFYETLFNGTGDVITKVKKLIVRPAFRTVIPNAADFIANEIDPTLYSTKTLEDLMIRSTPGVRSYLGKPMLNVLGEEITKRPHEGLVWSSRKDDEGDKVWHLISDNNAFISPVGKSYDIYRTSATTGEEVKDKMTEDELYELNKIRGAAIKKDLMSRFDELSELPKEEIQLQIRAIVKGHQAETRGMIQDKAWKSSYMIYKNLHPTN